MKLLADQEMERRRLTVTLDETGGEARQFSLCISRAEIERLDRTARAELRRMLVGIIERVTGPAEGEVER